MSNEIPLDLKVAVEIYRLGGMATARNIYRKFDNVPVNEISKCIDKLLDLGIITSDWKRVNNRTSIQIYNVSKDASGFIGAISKELSKNER